MNFTTKNILRTGKTGTGLCTGALRLRCGISSPWSSRLSWAARTYATQPGARWPEQQPGASISSTDLVKYGVPSVLLLGTILLVSRKDAPAGQTAPAEPAPPATAAAAAQTAAKESFIQVGQYTFHQREVEEAFIADPDRFIDDVLHLSADLAPLSATADSAAGSSARYRALCLFARNILLVDSACSSDVLRIARIHFEKVVRAERETVAYRLALSGRAVRRSVAGLFKALGSYISSHCSALAGIVGDQWLLLWHRVTVLF